MSLMSILTPNVAVALIALYATLATATGIVWGMARANPAKDRTELKLRVRSWWVILLIFSIAIAGTKTLSIPFLTFVSFLALKEFLSLIPTRRSDRRVLFWAYLAIPIQFYWIWIEWYGLFIIFIPVYVFLFLPLRMVMIGETKGFLPAAGTLHWGLMMTVFSIGHVAYLLALPHEGNPVGGGAGLVIFLVVLTELNDVFQFIWGKAFGRHKIIPRVSPNKTVEGFAGGVLTTVLLAGVIAPYLTPLSWPLSVIAGMIIGLGGFVGDVVVSAVKRDVGVKDSGAILPGHGGILDRIDSLTYTAPLFFHFVYYIAY